MSSCPVARRPVVASIAVLAFLTTSLACHGAAVDATAPARTSATVVDDGHGSRGTFGEQARLPDSWPADVPLYPGATLTSAINGPAGDGTHSWLVTADTTDTPAQVHDFYKSRIGAPYLLGADVDAHGGPSLTFTAADGKDVLLISATPSAGKTTIELSISKS